MLCFCKEFLIATILLFAAQWVNASNIKGKVIDDLSKEPLENVAVFIDGSSWATFTNKDGEFNLDGNFLFPCNLSFQLIAYESQSIKISNNGNLNTIISLTPKTQVYNEVKIIAPLMDGWKLYGDLFLKNFLSYSTFSSQCEIHNKDKIQFRFDEAKQTLFVSADEPLIIENKALGYIIHYDLKSFKYNFYTNEVFYSGNSRFEHIKSKNKKKIKKWNENRLLSYKGSIKHFMQSVYNHTVEKEGYVLNVIVRTTKKNYGILVPLYSDTLAIHDSDFLSQLTTKMLHSIKPQNIDTPALVQQTLFINRWKDTARKVSKVELMAPVLNADSISYKLEKLDDNRLVFNYYLHNRLSEQDLKDIDKFKEVFISQKGIDSNLQNERLVNDMIQKKQNSCFDYLYTTSWPIDSFMINSNNQIQLYFKDIIQVIYTHEYEEVEYIRSNYKKSKDKIKPLQTTALVFKNKEPITVLANGNYFNYYDLILEGYMGYEKLDKLLPLDYEP